MKKVAVIYPLDSYPTVVTYYFSQRALEILGSRKDLIIDEFPVISANRLLWILSRAFNSGYDFVIYAGHGLSSALIGQANIWIVPIGILIPMSDTSLAPKVRIFYSVACLTGRVLGKDYVRKRTLSYVGSEDYVFVAYPTPEHNYMSDFIDTWLTFVKYVVRGYTVGHAFDKMKARMKHYIDLYEEKERVWSYASFYKNAMLRNYSGFSLFGRRDVRL